MVGDEGGSPLRSFRKTVLMSKNTHLEHLEDSILFDGKQGAVDAFKFLDLLFFSNLFVPKITL